MSVARTLEIISRCDGRNLVLHLMNAQQRCANLDGLEEYGHIYYHPGSLRYRRRSNYIQTFMELLDGRSHPLVVESAIWPQTAEKRRGRGVVGV